MIIEIRFSCSSIRLMSKEDYGGQVGGQMRIYFSTAGLCLWYSNQGRKPPYVEKHGEIHPPKFHCHVGLPCRVPLESWAIAGLKRQGMPSGPIYPPGQGRNMESRQIKKSRVIPIHGLFPLLARNTVLICFISTLIVSYCFNIHVIFVFQLPIHFPIPVKAVASPAQRGIHPMSREPSPAGCEYPPGDDSGAHQATGRWTYGGFHSHGGSPKWMVFVRGNPFRNG